MLKPIPKPRSSFMPNDMNQYLDLWKKKKTDTFKKLASAWDLIGTHYLCPFSIINAIEIVLMYLTL